MQVKNLKEQTAALEQLEAELAGKNTGKSVDQVRSCVGLIWSGLVGFG